jgi:hypothetical protein
VSRKKGGIDEPASIGARLSETAREILAEERAGLGEALDGSDGWITSEARTVLETFVSNHFACKQDYRNEEQVVKAIQRVLAVDITLPANRQGAIPAALGLVSRANPERRSQHRTIVRLMELAAEGSSASLEDRAAGVSIALRSAGLNIDDDTVRTTYRRRRPPS